MAKSDDKTKKSEIDSSEPPWAKKAKEAEAEREEEEEEDEEEDEEDEDEEEDEEDEDEEEDEEEEAKAAPPVASKPASKPSAAAEEDEEDEEEEDEEDEDEEEDEEDEDEEEEEPREPPARSRGAAARPVSKRAPASRRPAPAAAKDDGLPDWLPWAVMLGLIAVGGLGALGIFSPKGAGKEQAETASTAAGSETVPDQISAQHLLVSYKGGMRASPTVTRTKEEAKARAEEALRKAKAGGDFSALVAEYSDEPGAATRKGNLGKFSRQMMVKPFSDAAFTLKVGGLSGVVETPFGYHVIKRTE